ncbi:MAG: divalent metal cation transporter [Gemmatimonadetes bacterium]|nr:divalent metal cation transporter [Gemmatimonadota bacterium]
MARGDGSFWRSFGPGLLWAGASIGISHLVQSTRAGANAGFGLAGVILLALVLKYPFFEFGPRYAAATGNSLVEGYQRIGRWAIWLYLILTVATALIVQVAVVLFTAFVLTHAFGLDWPLALVGGLICLLSAILLWVGRFKWLDASIKLVLVLLAISTLIAASVALPAADFSSVKLLPLESGSMIVSFAFVLALVGWMPTAIDLAVWSSLWTLAKDESEGSRSSVANARLDFNIGYVGTGILAFAFVMLGATVMYGSGENFSPQGTLFSAQLVELYVQMLGDWTRPVVLVAVITTMLSTSLTVIDGFPRALDRTVRVLRNIDPGESIKPSRSPYWLSLVTLAVLTIVVLAFFLSNLTAMIDFATIVSFLTAPVLGYLNLKAVTSADVPAEHRPGRTMLALSYVGLILLGGIAAIYLVTRFG